MSKNGLVALALGLLVLTSSCDDGRGEHAEKNKEIDTAYSGAKFNDHIRSTAAGTPEEERLGFKLPEGFEINLYAAEPDIGKPINFNFDAQGRMWVTQSFEYPFPAVPGKGKDRLTILEDTDNDGRADKFIHFDDTLNIPIGIMPVQKGAVVYSIPNVLRLDDKNEDGQPETAEKLLGPFEVKDTHGMVNNFTTGFDGWIHACHGYTNHSHVAGKDGDSVHLISGNTIRFKPDGSRVEHETAGRINPFGLVYDELGYLYSTDCHTSPLYQLIKGGDYPQSGKDEGMGFAPDMKPFDNEATALAGIAYYADTKFPEEFRKNLFIGDAVTSRVYRNTFVFKGSSPIGKKEPDFIKSRDPWFRPVAIQMGPDGALYIADFYNSIIGHYEVPLNHPKRDKIRGRIWRVTYKGAANKNTDLAKASIEQLVKMFNDSNLRIRMTAGDQLVDRIGNTCIGQVKEMLKKKSLTETEHIHGIWTLQRLGALTDSIILSAATCPNPTVRLHTFRAMAEQEDTSAALFPLIINALTDQSAHVQRATVELMGRYPSMKTVEILSAFLKKIPAYDSHLMYTTRLALRNLLQIDSLMHLAATHSWASDEAAILSKILIGVESPESGIFIYNYLNRTEVDIKYLPAFLKHSIRFVPAARINAVITTARDKAKKYPDAEYVLYSSLQQGLERRAATEPISFKEWGKKLAKDLLSESGKSNKKSREQVGEKYFAMSVAGKYKLQSIYPQVVKIYEDTSSSQDVKMFALRTMLKLHPEQTGPIATRLLNDPATSTEYKRAGIAVLSEFPTKEMSDAVAAVRDPAPDVQWWIIMALASSDYGKDILFKKVENGEVAAISLTEPMIAERIRLNITSRHKKKYDSLTTGIIDVGKEKQLVITKRISDYNNLNPPPSPEQGRPVFLKNCAPCHNIKGDGGHIGPQLDGVGKWGVTSLMEKVLDPNRNISENFRNYTIKMKDGKVLSGLYRREEGEVIVYANMKGEEFTVAKKEIAEKIPSKYTLMPDQFRNTISPEDFNLLIAYLLSQKND